MNTKLKFRLAFYSIAAALIIAALGVLTSFASPPPDAPLAPQADNPAPPSAPVKLIFIHHSTGGNWLADPNTNDSHDNPGGSLGQALMDNNYFVSATNYGWGPDSIGDSTDIPNWPEWFTGTIMSAVYTETGQYFQEYGTWPRLDTDPGGENEIIMFKSCFPNSDLYGNPDDPPLSEPNDQYTVENAKAVYNHILTYFAAHQEKLFIVITAPPLMDTETAPERAVNARAFNNWLMNNWLTGYPHNNVAVFDYYNVLTSNGGDVNTNDAGAETGNHHRWWNGTAQHTQTVSSNYSAYPSGDSHPTTAGHQKATAEFVQLLNVYYNRWQGGGTTPAAPTLTLTAPNGGETWTVGSQHEISWTSSGTIANVSLAYSTDNFVSSNVAIEASTANDGGYTWTIPDAPSASARVRVASVVSPTTVVDTSNADFTISAAGGNTYTFTAAIAPSGATQPVTYLWSPNPASGQGTTSAVYQWSGGSHTISVQAGNCGGSVNDTYTYTVGATRQTAPDQSSNYARQNALIGETPRQVTAQTAVFQYGVSPTSGYTGTWDVILASDADDNANLGGTENLESFFDDAEARRSLMRWDISTLPAEISVISATVELYRYNEAQTDPTQLALYRVSSDWLEGSGYDLNPGSSYTPDGATWLTATTTVPWTTPGGDYDATALDQMTIPAGTGSGWIRLDASDAVGDWVSGSEANYGLLLRPLSGDYTVHYFHSREAVTPTLRPRLLVAYTSGAPAPTLNITAPAVSTSWPVSSAQQIQWNTTGVVTQVNLSYSLGGGFTLIEAGVANSDSYAWTTPPTATTSARVRVESVLSPTQVYDLSDQFTLSASDVSTHTIYLPLILKSGSAACVPLTGVSISGPGGGSSGDLIQPADLTYLGAFAYPSGDNWAYSARGLAYYPNGDPGSSDNYPGSLYATGFDQNDLVGEITIPKPVVSSNFNDLPKASILQPLTDITGGWKDNCTYTDDCEYREVDGLAYLSDVDKITWNLRNWYNVTDYDQDSLGWSDLDMTGAQGVWHIGERPYDNDVFHNAKTCDYLFNAPDSFADANLSGNSLIAGNQREAGALGGSQGPTLYALAPWTDDNPPASGQNLDALALLYYPENIECVWEGEGDINEHPAPGVCDFPDYRGADHWNGGAWVQGENKSAVLVFGRKGMGDNCYGPEETCGVDPCATSSGYHAYPYQPQILFYNPQDLKAALAGTREPWETLPYTRYSPTDEVFGGECATLFAATYDRARGLLYVSEREAGEWGETAVHVWQVE